MATAPSDVINALINKHEEIGTLDTNLISDGSHTFEELYYHRMILFAAQVKQFKSESWKSKLHHDYTMFKGYFIVGIDTPAGTFTYHYESMYWSIFECKELGRAPEYDGHTSKDVTRLLSL